MWAGTRFALYCSFRTTPFTSEQAMKTVPDLPSIDDIDRLERALNAANLDRIELAEVLGEIEQALQRHGADLDQSGGLLTSTEEAARPALARQAGKLRNDLSELACEAGELSQRSERPGGEAAIRQRARELLGALRQQRDREADLKLESVVTDLGAGD
jgi:hypothetical protein